MRLPGRRRLARFGRWLRSRPRERVLVLGYHRVADVDEDPFDLVVSPAAFASHMELIAASGRALRLRELGAPVRNAGGTVSGIVVTLDDGYRDNLELAKPILDRFELPATVFVVTGSIGRTFWWCDLERAPAGADDHSVEIDVEAQGRTAKIAYRSSDSRARTRALVEVARLLGSATPAERQAVLTRILGHPGAAPKRAEASAMTAEELRRLSDDGRVELGAHTVTHPRLGELSEADQRQEIEGSRDDLTDLGLAPPATFSYPNGSLGPRTAELVREAGFVVACTSAPDVGTSINDRFHVPRFFVPDVGREEFARFLRRWL